jgi:hypothetical protein
MVDGFFHPLIIFSNIMEEKRKPVLKEKNGG